MNTRYFCAYHVERIKACESHALRCWVEMMRRGVQAYTECRLEAAQIYLGSALDIGLLRYACAENRLFEEIHLTKPADFMIELRLSDSNQNAALDLLNKIATVAGTNESTNGRIRDYIAKQRARREFSERAAAPVLPRKETREQAPVFH